MKRIVMAVLLTGLSACNGGPEADQTEQADTAGMGPAGGSAMPMQGMQGMDMGGRMSMQMMMDMRSRMQAMQGANADSMMAMMPMHRQMAANMIAQMNREMRDMDMQTDPTWDALVDSLRQDLARMPDLSPGEMQTFMAEHHRRMMRLMAMHERMMSEMGH